MATRIVDKFFNLITPEGKKRFKLGDEITGAVADHWYAKAHSYDPAERKAKEKVQPTPEQIAEATAKLVKGLVTEADPEPSMEIVNKALRDAQLPTIKAADRDAILKA